MKIIRHPTSYTTDRLQALKIMHVASKIDEKHVTIKVQQIVILVRPPERLSTISGVFTVFQVS